MSNIGNHAVAFIFANLPHDEMAALDALGPLTRAAICNCPVQYSAAAVLKQIHDYEAELRLKYPEHVRHLLHIDPKDPKLDHNVARGVGLDALKVLKLDRDEIDAEAGIIPLVPKIGVRSLREQRRSTRKIRW